MSTDEHRVFRPHVRPCDGSPQLILTVGRTSQRSQGRREVAQNYGKAERVARAVLGLG